MRESHTKRNSSLGVTRLVTFSAGLCVLSGVNVWADEAPLQDDLTMEHVTVIGTREATLKKDTPATVFGLDQAEIEEIRPAHPAELMTRVPGVHVNVTNGEGHMAAIRQPLSTKALYLYLEDGVPTRSTGFFNHNALYEVNLPQAGGVEIFKGPGTALYGSDAIGGVISVNTRPAPDQTEGSVNLELGANGWRRLLTDIGGHFDDHGLRGDLNLTRTDGWRDSTAYDRQSATLRWDYHSLNGGEFKTTLAASNIDQQTAGSSRLLLDDYLDHPESNYTPISYRKVRAFRLSTAYEREGENSLLSIIPFLRHNNMEMLPNWSLSYDPTVYETGHDSVGLLVKYRRNFEPMRARLITGMDLDYSPGQRFEQAINPIREAGIYTDYVIEETLYDYDVGFLEASPYLHLELSPLENLRATFGLRYDGVQYRYDNQLSELTEGSHKRPGDNDVSFQHFSPKIGAIYTFSPGFSGFLSYRHAFRVPSEGQLFRQGKAENTVDLDPVKVDSMEVGIRGQSGDRVRYEASLYRMSKKDDILTFKHGDGTRETMNAGETLHRGVEIALSIDISEQLQLNSAYSYAKHTYQTWRPNETTDYSGNEMESAPRLIFNTRLAYRPEFLPDSSVELEWERLGDYWMDQANTEKYDGHDVFNLRARYVINEQWQVYGRIKNLTDRRYATAASYKPAAWGSPEKFEYAPGMPRTLYLGVEYAL